MSAGDQNYPRAAEFKCLSDPTILLSVWIVSNYGGQTLHKDFPSFPVLGKVGIKRVSRSASHLPSRVISTTGRLDHLSKDARPNLKLTAIAAGAHTKPLAACLSGSPCRS
jgi:hypothetical protein